MEKKKKNKPAAEPAVMADINAPVDHAYENQKPGRKLKVIRLLKVQRTVMESRRLILLLLQ